MLKSSFSKMMVALLILAAGGIAWAATVTSDAVSGSPALGSTVQIPLKIKSATGVAGINGEFTYDSTYFSNPSIIAGPGASGFTVLGNLVSAGHYKFVVYSDPTKAMSTTLPDVYFQVKVTAKVAKSIVSTMTYPSPAASDTKAVSLTAAFSNVTLKLNGNGARDWALYE